MELIIFFFIVILLMLFTPVIGAVIVDTRKNDKNIVSHHPVLWLIGIVGIILGTGMVGYCIETNEPVGLTVTVGVIFILPFLWLFLAGIAFRLEYDEHSFTIRDQLFRRYTFTYRDIDEIRDTVSRDKLQISGATIIVGKEKIKLSNDMVGAEEFIRFVKRQCAAQAPAVQYTATPAAEKKIKETAATEKLTIYQLHQIVRNPKKTIREYVSVIVLLLALMVAYYLLTVFPVQFMPAKQAEIDFKSYKLDDGDLWLYDEDGTRYTIPRYYQTTQGTLGVTAYVSTAEKMDVSYVTGFISDPVVTDIKLASGQVLLKRKDVLKQCFSEYRRVLIPGSVVLLIWICRLVHILILSRDPQNATEEELKKFFHRDITDYINKQDK